MANIISQAGTIVVNGIITKEGRQKLASGVDSFKITKFAVADDQIDYSIQGLQSIISSAPTSYPILQPVINGRLMMKNMLYTDYNVNNGMKVLGTITVTGLSQSTPTNIPGNGTPVTYTPSTSGINSQLYNITLDLTHGNPFSSIGWRTSSNLSPLYKTPTGSVFTINNASQMILQTSNVNVNTYVTMTVVGATTGRMATFTIKVFPAPSTTTTTTQGDIR